jgi:hypothetical protein
VLARVLISGAATALAGLVGFGVVHAWLILPIWTQLLRGAPFALAAGIPLAWAFEEMSKKRGWHSALDGGRFGALMFSTLVPVTAFDTALRLSGANRDAVPIIVVEVALTVAAGGAAGWMLGRTRHSVAVFGIAALGLMVVSAGPLPVAQSVRGAQLALAIAVICVAAGEALVATRFFMLRQETR